LERCGKCAHDLLAVAAQLRGPLARVSPPMFLGGLLHGEAAAARDDEVSAIDLEEEGLDLGGDNAEAGSISLEEELPTAQSSVEEEVAIEMPSLSGIDVSDLVAPQEEAALVEAPEQEVGGIEMPASFMMESEAPATMAPRPAGDDDSLSLDFDLTGGESRGSAPLDEEAGSGGGVVDLADLLGDIPEAPAAPAGDLDDELDLTLDNDGPAPPTPAAAGGSAPDIPDLGLTLESDGEDDEPAS